MGAGARLPVLNQVLRIIHSENRPSFEIEG